MAQHTAGEQPAQLFLGFDFSWFPPKNVLGSTTCLTVSAEAEIVLMPEETFNLHLSLRCKKKKKKLLC